MMVLQPPFQFNSAFRPRCECVGIRFSGRELGDTMLRQRPFHQGRNVLAGVPHRGEPVRHVESLHERDDAVGENRAGILGIGPGHIGPERFGRTKVALRISLGGKSKDGRCVEDDRHPVRYHRVIDDISGGPIVADPARDGIRHAVRQMNARIAEPEPGISGGQEHLRTRLVVGRIFNRTNQMRGHKT